jgi:predicted Zn-dependent peptidase
MTRTISKTVLFLLTALLCVSCAQSKYKYESVPNDPMKTRIYTLENGLKVYLTVDKDQPRIQTYIAVRSGGKNDPHETTGLAHYFEHLMFKGTEQFGTSNYEAEKPYLDRIEQEFEKYRTLTDPAERKAEYHLIDSLSYEASKYAIPNEYDKLMAAIGSDGSNAYTSYDQTVFVEDIPSNQIDNWAKIQADRFEHNVIRLFHTELEAVYEEKNISLTSDDEKAFDKLMSGLFKNHPYGTQTVLGTQEQLKNPSITNIKNYYKEWYVPNNMAICMSGDFDPEYVISEIDKYFGEMKPNDDLKKLSFKPEDPIVTPEVYTVLGDEAPMVYIAWRLPGANDSTANIMQLTANMLSNGSVGLIDANVNQQQKVLAAGAGLYQLADYSIFILEGQPKAGQTLDEVKSVLLAQVDSLKAGAFADDILPATVNQYKVSRMMQLRNNSSRADMFVQSFINDDPWKNTVNQLDDMSKITKSDVVAYANKVLGANGYVQVNKEQGADNSIVKMEKPEITPVLTNRDSSSQFLRDIQATKVSPVAPVFVDFSKDLSRTRTPKGRDVLYKQNTGDGLFELTYFYDFGSNEDKKIGIAAQYLDYLGTGKMTADQIKKAFYDLACDYSIMVNPRDVSVRISGLAENMDKAIELTEQVLSDCRPDEQILANLKGDIIKDRADSKLNQRANYSMLASYVMYGPKNPANNVLTNAEVNALSSAELVGEIHGLSKIAHRILYFGPKSESDFVSDIDRLHVISDTLTVVPSNKDIRMAVSEEPKVLLAPYKANNIYLLGYSNRGEQFDASLIPIATLFNEYFGGGMNTVVFQEIREARGLAYSASSLFQMPRYKDESIGMNYRIITQNDKMKDAMSAFDEILNDMPKGEKSFQIAKDAIMSRLRTQRTLRSDVLRAYIGAERLGLDHDVDKDVFDAVPAFTMEDLVKFQEKWVKGRKYTVGILGDEKDLDLKALEPYGKIERVKTEDIFGY